MSVLSLQLSRNLCVQKVDDYRAGRVCAAALMSPHKVTPSFLKESIEICSPKREHALSHKSDWSGWWARLNKRQAGQEGPSLLSMREIGFSNESLCVCVCVYAQNNVRSKNTYKRVIHTQREREAKVEFRNSRFELKVKDSPSFLFDSRANVCFCACAVHDHPSWLPSAHTHYQAKLAACHHQSTWTDRSHAYLARVHLNCLRWISSQNRQ